MTDDARQTQALKSLHQQLALAPLSFAQLWQDHAPLWQTLGWSEAQARLYLRSLAGIVVNAQPADGDSAALSFHLQGAAAQAAVAAGGLADEVVAVLGHSGRPMPLTTMLHKMPKPAEGQVLTEAKLRAALAADPRLSIIGPMVRLS